MWPMKTVWLALITALLMPLAGCEKEAPAPIRWRLQSQAVSSANDFKELQLMAENIRIMSNGRLLLTPIAGDDKPLAVGADIFTAVSSGRIEMGNGWPNWWEAQHPAWAVMNAGAFDFMTLEASMLFFLGGEGTAFANQLSLPKGVLWRPAWWPGMEFGLLSKTPIRTLADLKGKKVRIGPGLPSELLSAASGAYGIPTVPVEIRPELARGALDAVEWTTTSGAWELGLQDLSPYAIVPAIWQPAVLSDFLINKQAYDALPADLQRILDTAIKAYTLSTTVNNKLNDFAALDNFRLHKTEIVTWNDADLRRWKQASDAVYQKYQAADTYTRQLIDAKRAFKQRYDDYYLLFGPYDVRLNEPPN